MMSSSKLFLILYYIKQIDSKLPCVCSVIDHRGRQNVVRTSVTHSAAPRVPLFCSYRWPLVLGSFFLSPLVVSDVVTPNFRDTILWNPVRRSYHSVTWTINVRWSRCAKWSRTWTFFTNLLWMWYLVEWNLLLAVRN